ncbi:MAG: hypothetical protein ACN6NV_11780 [Acinetobacter gandensis]|uniref:hypothetical protein n=1 Tax=Acinetobacter gandensis TaxID=1443941 RepID=UPI003D070249
MNDLGSPLEELSLFETWVITSHKSSMAYDLLSGKNYKKIIKTDSPEALKINTFNHFHQITGVTLSQKSRESFDDFIYKKESYSSFLQSLKDLRLYPNQDFPLFNKHIEIYNELEKNNFCESQTKIMHDFLYENFLITDYKLIKNDMLNHRDYNIFLILYHLDSLIFKNFNQASIFKFLLIGKIKGQKQSTHHRFWNLVKVLSCIEANQKLGTFIDTSKKQPKDEESFSFVNEKLAEHIKYEVRKLKEGKNYFFYLNHFYYLLGSKYTFEDTKSFSSFSITGLWLIYIYSVILIKPESIIVNLIAKDLDSIYLMFKLNYKSEGIYEWPSAFDL